MGVDLFFVLSGLLISTLLIRERASCGRVSLGSFWLRRFLRLFPAYYGLLAGLGVYYWLKPADANSSQFLGKLWVYAAYLSNWVDPQVHNLGHTWTLATEEQFYLFWPLIEAMGRPCVMGFTWIAALVANQMMNFGLFDHALRSAGLMDAARSSIVEVTYTPILLGVGLAHLLHRPAGFRGVARLVQWPGAPLVFAGSFVIILASGLRTFDGLPRLGLHLLICLFFAAILVRPGSATTRFLESPPLRYLGTISYGMYLYHMIGMFVADRLIGHLIPGTLFPVTLGITTAIAAVSYPAIEKPFLKLGDRFRPARIVRDPVLAEAAAAPEPA